MSLVHVYSHMENFGLCHFKDTRVVTRNYAPLHQSHDADDREGLAFKENYQWHSQK